MDLQKIAQELVDELNGEIKKSQENTTLLNGAVQGVNLLYNRLRVLIEEAEKKNAEDNKVADEKPAAKKRKKPVADR